MTEEGQTNEELKYSLLAPVVYVRLRFFITYVLQ